MFLPSTLPRARNPCRNASNRGEGTPGAPEEKMNPIRETGCCARPRWEEARMKIPTVKMRILIFTGVSFENTRLGMRTKRPAGVPSYPRKRVSRLIRRNKPGFPRQPEADPSFGGCAGMTSRGGHHGEGNPSIFILGG